MTDIYDQATHLEELDREIAILNQHNECVSHILPKTGMCHNCQTEIDQVFCDIECEEDYWKRKVLDGGPKVHAVYGQFTKRFEGTK